MTPCIQSLVFEFVLSISFCRIERSGSWIAEVETSLSAVCDVEDTVKGAEWTELREMTQRSSPEWS